MTGDSKAMALIRELCRECNDDELYQVWFLLTGIMLTKRTADELQEAFK